MPLGRNLHRASVLLLVILGLLALAAYPTRDDWTWAVLGRDQGFLGGLSTHWHHWSGRWAYSLVMLAGGHLGPAFIPTYPLWPLATIAAVTAGAIALTQRMGYAPAWGVVLAAPLALMPGSAEGLFWQSGTVGYVLPLGLGALALTRPDPRTTTQRLGLLLAGCVLGGWTETPAILLTAWALTGLHRTTPRWLLAGLAIGMGLMVSAPGNAARLELVGGWKPLGPALGAGFATVTSLLFDLVTSPWLIAQAALIAHLAPPTPPAKHWATLAIPFLAALAAATASCATVGFCEPRQASALWLHLVLSILALAWTFGKRLPPWAFTSWLVIALAIRFDQSHEGVALIGHLAGSLALILLLLHAGWRRLAISWPLMLTIALLGNGAFFRLVDDTLAAPRWRWHLAQRDTLVQAAVAAGQSQVSVPLMEPNERPRSLSTGDLMTGGDWQGCAYANWMGIKNVRVEPPRPLVTP